jgi:phosphoribosylformylglycinamidine synthase subunit PurQ / glutaminase
MSVAIIQFPGSNCEQETLRACLSVGIPAQIVRWNTPHDQLRNFSAYILPGGFSYQDRVRAGAIAAKLSVMQIIKEADALNKPILGICNGCQILAESGIMPNTDGTHSMEVALAPNQTVDGPVQFMCEWVTVKIENPESCIFTRSLPANTPIAIPMNHGEGRFMLSDKTLSAIQSHTTMRYTSPDGSPAQGFPANPNGSTDNIAAISNKKGNVLATMPHPERATFLKQLPHHVKRQFGTPLLWDTLFTNLKIAIEVTA